jgi:acetylornithine deacetylase/succinyl-diaminopimelate desuccinylase-like protein
VDLERVTGGINMFFLFNDIGNAYNNLTNVVLTITPAGEAGANKAVMISAHYDTVIGSAGK